MDNRAGNRAQVREFLISRRERITPEQAGLPAYGGNRRVKGLRREEVALLAGVSIDAARQAGEPSVTWCDLGAEGEPVLKRRVWDGVIGPGYAGQAAGAVAVNPLAAWPVSPRRWRQVLQPGDPAGDRAASDALVVWDADEEVLPDLLRPVARWI